MTLVFGSGGLGTGPGFELEVQAMNEDFRGCALLMLIVHYKVFLTRLGQKAKYLGPPA